MRPVQSWLDEYGESHVNQINKMLHWVCVPLIVLSLVGALWSLPVPQAFRDISPLMNWGMLFVLASIVYYFIMSVPLALGMLLLMAPAMALLHWASDLTTPLWMLSLGVFVVAWIGQFIGHMVEGQRPSFFKDLQFLMIGPIWLLGFVYRRLGIPY
ncbi:MAG: DUF962 domain-containing protein [Gammaproteobacteria bacterium]